MAQETATEKKTNPILPFIKIPENYPEEDAYLWGVKCNACGTKFLGERIACGKCGATGNFEEVRYGTEGELYVFAVVHQAMPDVKTPFIAGIIDLDDGVSVRANVYGLDPEKPDHSWFGKRVKMFSEVTGQDRDGNDVVAVKYKVQN
ncbi:MAG: OB-fold domain-containing protein [Dehalococcoidia bacterium]|nr:OB-fold domain-containing protein [Dehalococcoidia bacterium]